MSADALPDQTACTVWTCQVGVVGNLRHLLPRGADAPMREAIERRFARVLGVPAEFTFSGWGDPLPESYLAVVENREPVYELTEFARDEERDRLAGEVERLKHQIEVAVGYIRDSAKERSERLNLAELALAYDEIGETNA